MPKVLLVEKLTTGPIGIGTVFRQAVPLLGQTIKAEWEIVEYEPNRRFLGRSLRGIVDFEGGYKLTDSGNRRSTTITKHASCDLSLAPPFLPKSVVELLMSRELGKALANLKTILEKPGDL